MKRIFALAVCGLACLVSGCVEPKLPLADVAVIKAVNGDTDGMDIYALRRANGEDVPALRGNQIVEIRTYLPRTNDFGNEVPGQEVSGALCEAILDNHHAKVRTPGGIHVPIYGYRTAPFSVTCQMDGFNDAIVVANPFNKTIADRRASASAAAAGGGALGVLVAAVVVEGINAASDETNDVFHYNVPPILMRQGSSGTVIATGSAAEAAKEASGTVAAPPASANAQATGAETAPQPAALPKQPVPARASNQASARQVEDTLCAPWCGEYD